MDLDFTISAVPASIKQESFISDLVDDLYDIEDACNDTDDILKKYDLNNLTKSQAKELITELIKLKDLHKPRRSYDYGGRYDYEDYGDYGYYSDFGESIRL